jgi:hypothetical protein
VRLRGLQHLYLLIPGGSLVIQRRSVHHEKIVGNSDLTDPVFSVYTNMTPDRADNILALAETTPVAQLPRLIGDLHEAIAVCNMRLLTPAPNPTTEAPQQLVDRREASRILGVSTYYLEGKRLSCETRAGRKILYPKSKLEQYVRQGHVPYEDR